MEGTKCTYVQKKKWENCFNPEVIGFYVQMTQQNGQKNNLQKCFFLQNRRSIHIYVKIKDMYIKASQHTLYDHDSVQKLVRSPYDATDSPKKKKSYKIEEIYK